MHTRAIGLLVVAVVGCGGEPEEGGEALEAPPVVEPDAGQAAPLGDAGGPAPADGGATRPAPAAQCAADAGAGRDTTSACWSLAELAARGCVAVWRGTPDVGTSTTATLAGAESAASSARFALWYNTGRLTLYMCSGAAPVTDWRCVAHELADCSYEHGAEQGSCTVRVRVPALPTVNAICTRGEPS